MHNTQKNRSGLVVFFFQIQFQQIGQGSITGFIALRHLAR
jgi:hypothetical protein